MAKFTNVELETLDSSRRQTFEINHAERILRIRESGWRLPSDSNYYLDDNGIGYKESKRGSKASKETPNDSESNTSPKQD